MYMQCKTANIYGAVHASEKLRRLIKLDLTHSGSECSATVCPKSIARFYTLCEYLPLFLHLSLYLTQHRFNAF